MTQIDVHTSKNYPIFIENGLFSNIAEKIIPFAKGCRIAVLTDDHVAPLYLKKLMQSLTDKGFSAISFVIPNGESSKSPENLFAFLGFLAENHLTRTDLLIALGGGVVGDLCGFAASIYLRGVRFIQIPTTLLAAVDSSVGGKTAVDIPAGKNLVGSFWQPEAVFCDPNLLKTLPSEIFRDGCAEVLKYGAALDRELWERLKNPIGEEIDRIIAKCIEIKRDIVEQDERDNGMRGLLNFGHTLGHGIEKHSDFTVSHGSAVAIGMVLAAKIALALGLCSSSDANEIETIIRSYGFSVDCPYSAEKLFEAAMSDKKRSGNRLTLILPQQIGHCVLYPMDCDALLPLLKEILIP